MEIRHIRPDDDGRLATIIRDSLREKGLDVPGTAYFDPELDHLSNYYLAHAGSRRYLVLVGDDGIVEGGVGLARLTWDPACAEVQKLYLSDAVKGHGWGHALMEALEREARDMGFSAMYLETHSALSTAVALYGRLGYVEIAKPAGVIHSAMDTFMRKELDGCCEPMRPQSLCRQ